MVYGVEKKYRIPLQDATGCGTALHRPTPKLDAVSRDPHLHLIRDRPLGFQLIVYATPVFHNTHNRESCLSCQLQQVAIAAYKHIRFSRMCQIEKRLVFRVPAINRTLFVDDGDFAVGKVIRQQFLTILD